MRRPFEQPAVHHARLAGRAAAGDRAAFVELYRALYPPVARFVARRVAARADAEDVVARTFHRLLEALPAETRELRAALAGPGEGAEEVPS